MKQTIIYLLIVTFAISYSSCKKSGGECEEPLDIRQSEVNIIFIDSGSSKYIYTQINPLLNKDSLKVFDPSGNSLIILKSLSVEPTPPYNEFWKLSFGNIYDQRTNTNAFNTEICKEFIVQYQHNDWDTITTCFKAQKTECGSVFESLKVFYKGKLLATENNQTSTLITFLKN